MPSAIQRRLFMGPPWTPYGLPNTAARYSLDGAASDSTYLIDGSNRLMLVADRSGNSATSGLVIGAAAAGNYASSPNAAPVQITGSLQIDHGGACAVWGGPSTSAILVGKDGGGGQSSFLFWLETDKKLYFRYSNDGTVNRTAASTAINPFSNFDYGHTRVTYNSATGDVKFYTSTDGTNYSQLGATVTLTAGSIFNGTSRITVGQQDGGLSIGYIGAVYYARVYNGIGGTLVWSPTFSSVSKLASSFTESSANAATVTINTSGDTGARISGARDLYQGTQAKQAIFTASSSGNYATFDGVNDYMKAAPFSLSQPESDYSVLSSVSWTDTDYIFAGNAATSMGLIQSGITPAIVINAGSSVASNTGLAVGIRAVVRAIFNGASSALAVNNGTATTGNAGATAGGGFTLGAASDGTLPGNITWSETLIRSADDDTPTQLRIAGYEIRKWSIVP